MHPEAGDLAFGDEGVAGRGFAASSAARIPAAMILSTRHTSAGRSEGLAGAQDPGPQDPSWRSQRSYTFGMTARKSFTADEARRVGEEIGIDWASAPFDVEQFRMGMDVELEHGLYDLLTNVTDDDPAVTGKIALAHLNEFPDYYTRLERMEREAERGEPA